MQIQLNSDNHTPLGADGAAELESVIEQRLSRVADRITRVEVHVSETTSGASLKRCSVEIRPTGMEPLTATAEGTTFEKAATGATTKVMTALDRQIGKTTNRKGR